MSAMSELAGVLMRLAEGQEVTAPEVRQAKLYLDHLDTQHRQAANVRKGEQPTTVKLRDGRVVDVFPSGNVQVYTADLRHGYEMRLPVATVSSATVDILVLG